MSKKSVAPTRKPRVKETTYRVGNGFNTTVDVPAKRGQFGPGIPASSDGRHEVRYEIGMVVKESQLPKTTDVGWLRAKGCLVLVPSKEVKHGKD